MWIKHLLATGIACIIPGTVLASPALDPYADVRWRLELVDQDGLARDATASTVRLRAGIKTDRWNGFSALVEAEMIARVGPARFNDTVNGLTAFPVVADPSDQLLNQALLRYDHKSIGNAAVGRQTVNIDNQRWIGSVGWRQNDQTFDMASAEAKPVKGVSLRYAYGWRVNRVFGPDSPQGIWRNTDIHLLRGSAEVKPVGTIAAYGWLLDIPDSPLSSSKTFGARLTGRQPLGNAALTYAVEFARQSDHSGNPRDFSLSYLLLEPGIAIGPVTAKLGLERLEGNGATGLQAPLGTLHAFNGWADKFLTTPSDGLRDLYLDITVAPVVPAMKALALRAVYHDFRSTEGNRRYGRELDLQVGAPVGKHVSLLAKAAIYDARAFATDTTKFWLQAEVKY